MRSAPSSPAKIVASPGQLHEQFDRRKRYVQEEPDAHVGAKFPQHSRHELQLVVVNPHGPVRRHAVGHGLGEAHVHLDVGLPPVTVKRRGANRVVIERPQRGVGESQVEVLILVFGDVDRFKTYSLVGLGNVPGAPSFPASRSTGRFGSAAPPSTRTPDHRGSGATRRSRC